MKKFAALSFLMAAPLLFSMEKERKKDLELSTDKRIKQLLLEYSNNDTKKSEELHTEIFSKNRKTQTMYFFDSKTETTDDDVTALINYSERKSNYFSCCQRPSGAIELLILNEKYKNHKYAEFFVSSLLQLACKNLEKKRITYIESFVSPEEEIMMQVHEKMGFKKALTPPGSWPLQKMVRDSKKVD